MAVSPLPFTERRRAKPSVLTIGLAALAMAGIVFATLCPIGSRPHLAGANEERFAAYFVLGLLLALAAPRRRLAMIILVVIAAAGLEAGQLLVAGRDARFIDAAVKAIGGVLGVNAGYATFPLKRMIARFFAPPSKPPS